MVVALAAASSASASVTFDRAFGAGVDTGGGFENCTAVSGCQAGTSSGAAGSLPIASGIAVDVQGRIYVADRLNNRINRFIVAGDGSVGFDIAFGVDVDPSDGDTGDFETCTTASGCKVGTASGVAGGLQAPAGLALDAVGGLVVADEGNYRIDRFAVAGNGPVSFDRAWGLDVSMAAGTGFENCTGGDCQRGTNSRAAGGMNGLSDVAVDPQGRILAAQFADARIDRFAVAGDGTVSFDRGFGVDVDTSDGNTGDFENCTSASGCDGSQSGIAGGMFGPTGVDVDPAGRIVVADDGNSRIDRFTVAGNGVVSPDRSFGIDVDPSDGDNGDFENCTVATGCQAGTLSDAAGGMDRLGGLAVDAQGNVIVVDAFNNRINRYSVAGDGTASFDRSFGVGVSTGAAAFENCAAVCQAGVASSIAGGMSNPFAVGLDTRGRILVGDTSTDRVDRFSPGPTITVTKALGPGSDPGRFDLRVDGAVVRAAAGDGDSGILEVADGADVTINELSASGPPLSEYDTTIDCGLGPSPGTGLAITNVTANVNCTITNERIPATPTITGASSPHITIGGQVRDTATLAGGRSPTGNITFRLYGPGDASCAGAPVFTDTANVTGNGARQSAEFIPASTGTYRWTASYGGDVSNDPVATTCGAAGQSVTVSPEPEPEPPPPGPDPALQVMGVELDRGAGTATLSVATNVGGNLTIDKTNKVMGNGPVAMNGAGTAELEVVARNKAARKLSRTGRMTVNPRVRLIAAGEVTVAIRHELTLRQD